MTALLIFLCVTVYFIAGAVAFQLELTQPKLPNEAIYPLGHYLSRGIFIFFAVIITFDAPLMDEE